MVTLGRGVRACVRARSLHLPRVNAVPDIVSPPPYRNDDDDDDDDVDEYTHIDLTPVWEQNTLVWLLPNPVRNFGG